MAAESIVTKLNAQVLSKAVEQTNVGAERPSTGMSFQEVLNESTKSSETFADMMGIRETNTTPTAHMESLNGDAINFVPEQAEAIHGPDGSRKVVEMLSEVNKSHLQMDSLVNHILYSGKRFNNQELLVIQAHVFHIAQMSELTVKVAEQGVSSVKAVLNTQLQ